jgi:hypothetical protein
MSSFMVFFSRKLKYFSDVAVLKILWMNVLVDLVLICTLHTFYCLYFELSNAENLRGNELEEDFLLLSYIGSNPDPP